jgi:hypothetical protein
LAHSDVNEIPFAPDAVRAEVLEPVVDAERNLRAALLKRLREAVEKPASLENISLRRNTTPLAAIVFQRAKNRRGIGSEIRRLREELSPTRNSIRKVEDESYWATHDEEARARKKWERVFEAIDERFGKAEGVVTCDGLLGFAEKAAEVLLDPFKWPRIAKLPVDLLIRYRARRPIIEIHRLAPELRGSQAFKRSVVRLFGTVV